MKRKLIVGIILIIFSFLILLNFYNVKAYSGELDPESYITLPSRIWLNNGIGTATIHLSSSASDYSISYQKIDIDQSTCDTIQSKGKELTDYIEEVNNTLKEKEANINTLQTEYLNLRDDETATDTEIEEAYNKYNVAYQEYQQFLNTANTNIDTLNNEFYELIPNYTSSWENTTNSSNNIQLDFSDYTGTVYFILWVKITNGTNTYYDMNVYSSIVEEEETVTINKSSASIKIDETLQLTANSSTNSDITWTSSNPSVATVTSGGLVKGIKEGSTVITAKGDTETASCTVTVTSKVTTETPDEDEETYGEWTDFSNAKFELKKEGISGARIEISNVTGNENSSYYILINSNNDKPNITNNNFDEKILLTYERDEKMFKTMEFSKVARYVELNQDIYISIVEKQISNEKIVIYGKKLERFSEPKYSDAFQHTFMTHGADQIVTAFTHVEENNRKIQIKVGRITDKTILQKIKNQDSSGFANLLSFAKSKNGIYNKTVDADKDDWYAIEYNAGVGTTNNNSVINLSGLKDEEYYFLYIKTDDENGKYISNEAVTLAQAGVDSKGWGLFFYGSADFEWEDWENVSKDESVAPGVLPQTGSNVLVWIALGIFLVGGGTFSYIQYRKNKWVEKI